jgi:drug/metabolite transporter (DMT)-like permease
VIIALGVVLAGVARKTATIRHRPRAGVPWAVAAAAAFGLSLYATGRAGAMLPVAWALLPPRLVATLVVTLPLAATGRLLRPHSAAPLVAAAGLCEVAGFTFYTLGARHDIAVAAVLVSLFGAVAAVLGRVVLKERLSAIQVAGVATIVAGVAALGLVAS